MKKLTLGVWIAFLCMFIGCFGCIKAYAGTNSKSSVKAVFDKKTGTMTISGTGDMPDDMMFDDDKRIKRVVIEPGVTSVSRSAFNMCTNIKSIQLPEGLLSIGCYSFQGTNIKKLVIPSTVKDIGQCAFWGCERLKWITMPGDFTLHYDEKDPDESIFRLLTSHGTDSYAPKKITFTTPLKIENVSALSAKYLVVSKDDPNYKSIKGAIYTKDGTTLVRIPSERKSFRVPDGVSKVFVGAFSYSYYAEDYCGCCKLTKLYLPKGKCEAVLSTDTEESIGAYGESGTLKIIAKDTELDGHSIEILADYCNMDFPLSGWGDKDACMDWFISGFGDLIEVSENDYLISKDGLLLWYFGDGGKVKLDENVTGIGKNSFCGSDVTSISIPKSVKYIGDYAFMWSKLEKITIPAIIEEYGESIFSSSTLTSISFEEGMEKIPDGICFNCGSLKKVNFPSSLKEIGKSAFQNCGALNIDKFSGFENLDNLTTIGEMAFYNCKISKFVLPESVTTVGSGAFEVGSFNAKESELVVMGDTSGYDQRFYGGKVSATFEKGLKQAKIGIRWRMYYDEPDKNGKLPVSFEWYKVNGIDGYEVEGSVNADYSNPVRLETVETEARLDLKAGKEPVTAIYLRVRAFKNLDDKGNREYSEWNNEIIKVQKES